MDTLAYRYYRFEERQKFVIKIHLVKTQSEIYLKPFGSNPKFWSYRL